MTKRLIFTGACLAAIIAVGSYIAITGSRGAGGLAEKSTPPSPDTRREPIGAVPDGPLLLFIDIERGDAFGRLALVRLPLGDPPSRSPVRMIAPVSCERVHYANGWGLCLASDQTTMPVRYTAFVFDRSFQRRPVIALTGPPIRARVSPDGRRAALTVFETGHSYADGTFSTRTNIVDTISGRKIADLEDFRVRKDGALFKAEDFNFWGVTFAMDGDRFYATLKTGAERYLIQGSVDAREATVMRSGVECPSLSPDGRRIVFKKPLVSGVGWRLHALDLETGAEHPLNQVQRSVDDQVDWFDASHVVYHDSAKAGTGIWILGVDEGASPSLLLPGAYSPAVQR